MKKIFLLIFAFVLLIGTMTGCGNKINSRIPAIAGYINNNAELVEEIEYEKGKQLRLFEDHLEFDKNKILYNDIEIIRYSSNTYSYADTSGCSSSSYFVEYTFVLSNGDKHKIKCGGSNFFSATVDDETKLAVNTFVNVVYTNVARSVAQRAYNQISNGDELNIAGLTVNSDEAIGKNNTPINIYNYGKCEFSGENIRIISKNGEELFRVKQTEDNADLLKMRITSKNKKRQTAKIMIK